MSDFPSEEAILEPKRIQVFGVLHVVFGGLGLLNIVLGTVMMPIQRMLLTKQAKTAPTEEQRMIAEIQLKFYEKIGEFNWISWLMAGIIAGLILAAGIALLKRKKTGLKLSNIYAWASIVGKLVGILIFFLLVKPAVSGMMEEVLADLGSDTRAIITFINVVMVIAGVLGPLLGAIYPILTLVMLNKDPVRQHLK